MAGNSSVVVLGVGAATLGLGYLYFKGQCAQGQGPAMICDLFAPTPAAVVPTYTPAPGTIPAAVINAPSPAPAPIVVAPVPVVAPPPPVTAPSTDPLVTALKAAASGDVFFVNGESDANHWSYYYNQLGIPITGDQLFRAFGWNAPTSMTAEQYVGALHAAGVAGLSGNRLPIWQIHRGVGASLPAEMPRDYSMIQGTFAGGTGTTMEGTAMNHATEFIDSIEGELPWALQNLGSDPTVSRADFLVPSHCDAFIRSVIQPMCDRISPEVCAGGALDTAANAVCSHYSSYWAQVLEYLAEQWDDEQQSNPRSPEYAGSNPYRTLDAYGLPVFARMAQTDPSSDPSIVPVYQPIGPVVVSLPQAQPAPSGITSPALTAPVSPAQVAPQTAPAPSFFQNTVQLGSYAIPVWAMLAAAGLGIYMLTRKG